MLFASRTLSKAIPDFGPINLSPERFRLESAKRIRMGDVISASGAYAGEEAGMITLARGLQGVAGYD